MEKIKKYGKTGLIIYLSVSSISLASCYGAVSMGINIPSLLHKFTSEERAQKLEGAGTFAVAYVAHKLLAPVRIAVSMAITVALAKQRPMLVKRINDWTLFRSSNKGKLQ